MSAEAPPPATTPEQPAAPGPETLILVPLRSAVLFPGVVMPIAIGRPSSIRAIEEAVRREQPVGFVLQRDPNEDAPGLDGLRAVGTSADLLRIIAGEAGRQVLVRGRRRVRILEMLASEPYFVARVEAVPEVAPESAELRARVLNLREEATRAIGLLPRPVPELAALVERIEDPSLLVDLVSSSLDIPAEEKQELLETFDVAERIRKASEKLARQIEILEITKKIGSETKEALEKTQREYFLREQLKAIRRELGEEDGRGAEIEALRKKIEEAKMPAEVEQQALSELSHLERLPEGAAEHSVVRTYLDVLTDLPWSIATDERIDLAEAREILEAEHEGLEKAKKRVLEFLAVRKLNPHGRSPILCLVGPPGVGKTSLGRSIARAMNRKFVRQSLGGVHDEAEIRGHRRTYVGALPGRIIQGIRKAKTRNPVFMLDEVDKLTASFHGDPSAALLEVLDPEQNSTFEDHYLGVPFDLSQVLFIATANVLHDIPGPLRDRMEVIELPGYTEQEKVAIARRFLVPRQVAAAGLPPEAVAFDDRALAEVIGSYTREAGVRQLEREIAAICRAVAVRFAEGRTEPAVVRAEDVAGFLGPVRFFNEAALRTSLPGVATGLAWTPSGGEIMFIEATRMPGDGKLILTGQLGDVMKESAQAALSLVKTRAAALRIDPAVFRESDIHVHVPSGAIPKDGPSAGVALFVALASLLSGRCVRHDVAMTGEISLRGLVLPVGGIKEKVLAARRAGLARVLLPALNRKDLDDVPPRVLAGLDVEPVEDVDGALALALEPEAAPAEAA
jgi:ATP-dependent Lon protease